MKDEIKENLSEMLFNRDERLLDCITNLQEENERLKDYLKIMEKGKDNNLNRFLDYKSRNEKAIEYIKNDLSLGVDTFGSVYSIGANKVLNILNGGDDNG